MVELAAAAGLFLDPWQEFCLESALWERPSPDDEERWEWSSFEVGILVPRQNGKGAILEARELGGLFLFEESLILHSAHEFKDLDVRTPVLATRGWTTMGELRDGDEVYAPDGTPTKVVHAHPWLYDSRCYRVRLADGQELVAGAEHLWPVTEVARDGSTTERVVTTEQLLDGPGLVHTWRRERSRDRHAYRWRLALPQPPDAPAADLPVDPYLLGAWLGDGHTTSGVLTVGAEDLPALLGELDALGETYRVREDKRTDGRVLAVRVVGLTARLRALGVLGNKHVPAAYLTASVVQRRALLAGLMDTDGTVSAHQLAITMSNEPLMADVAALIRSLGYRATLREFRARLGGRDAGPMWRAQFAPNGTSPFRLSRKTERIRALRTSRSAYNAVVAVERVPTRPTRCITVAHESGCYLAGRGLVPTHNTSGEAFRRVKTHIDNTPWMQRKVASVSTAHGSEGIELKPSRVVITGSGGKQRSGGRICRLRFVARTGGSARGFTADLVIWDEAFNIPEAVVGAQLPTLSAVDNPQLWYTSSAVDKEVHQYGVTLARVRARALAEIASGQGIAAAQAAAVLAEAGLDVDGGLTWLEWQGAEDEYLALINDRGMAAAREFIARREEWARANPGVGFRLQPRRIAREMRAMGLRTFAVERLNIGAWPSIDELERKILPARWDEIGDPDSRPVGPITLGVEVSLDGRTAAIASAGERADAKHHVKVVDHRPGGGTAWVVDRVMALVERHEVKAVVINPAGQAGTLVADLENAGLPAWSPRAKGKGGLVALSAREYAQACGELAADVSPEADRLRHCAQDPLSDAVREAGVRELAQAWAWDQAKSTADVTPLVAATLALHGFRVHGKERGVVPWGEYV